MKTLVIRGRGLPAPAPRGEGTRVVVWSEESLPPDDADAVDEAAMAWTKAWGARPLRDGKSFRDLLAWKGVSLWWFAELYLFHSTESPRHVRTIETLHRMLDAERPDEVEAVGLPDEDAVLLERTCVARGVLFHGRHAPPRWLGFRTRLVSLRARWNGVKTFLTALKARIAGSPPIPAAPGKRPVLFLSHAAFWRRRHGPETEENRAYEHYFDALIPEVARRADLHPVVVAVGPSAAFRRRGAGDRLREWLRLRREAGPYLGVGRYTTWAVFRHTLRASAQARDAWRALRGSPGMREAFSHRGVAFDDLAGPDLAATLLLQLPWAVRSYEEMAAALQSLRPAAVCLYAESSGWGRAALAACRAAAVPTVAVQHGIIYPKYYSYRHGPGEEGCPRPDKTAVFGEEARRLLVEMGGYAPESLAVTGSPKFDDLVVAAGRRDRREIRARLGAGDEDRVVLVASRYRGIRSTHPAIGPAFPALVRSVEGLDRVLCVVKPHPAEPARAYEADVRGARRVRVVAPGADPTEALRRLLFDPGTRRALEEARRRYLSEVAAGVDGGATRRLLDLIAATAGAPRAETAPEAAAW